MEFIVAYGAGLLTLINPCVLPVLPIVLASALQASPRGPLMLAAGMSLSFVVVGVAVNAFGHVIGLTSDDMARFGAWLMVGFGMALLIPAASTVLTKATSGLASRADATSQNLDHSNLVGQFLGGMLLGAVWSPCVGPTLGIAIGWAAQGENLLRVTLIMTAFALGVSTLMLLLAYGTRGALTRHNAQLRRLATRTRPLLGIAFVLVGAAILLRWTHAIDAWLLGVMPAWLVDLSVAI